MRTAATPIKTWVLLMWVAIFSFAKTAPAQTDTSPTNNAMVISATIPNVVLTGSVFTVSITFSNSGQTVWNTSEHPAFLNAASPPDIVRWTTEMIPMRLVAVPPAETATFEFKCHAPVNSGFFSCDWSLEEKGMGPFGEIFRHIIQVVHSETDSDCASTILCPQFGPWLRDTSNPQPNRDWNFFMNLMEPGDRTYYTGAGVLLVNGQTGDKPVPGDYNGDGKADAATWRPSDGTWRVCYSGGGQMQMQNGLSTDIPVPGDYNGDRKTDAAVWRPSDGIWRVHFTGGGEAQMQNGVSTDIPVSGDYNGDGKTDAAVWRPSDGTWRIHFTGGGEAQMQNGISTDIPVPGDYNGDGKTDAAVWRPSEGRWFITYAGGGQFSILNGLSTDIPVPADYDGDGKTDFACWRPSEGRWYIYRAGGEHFQLLNGLSSDVPVPGDFNGDRRTDIACWRPSEGRWYIYYTGGGVLQVQSGANTSPPTSSTNQLFNHRDFRSYAVQSWHTDDGLPYNAVQALAQTADGYLWVGTQGGLSRFDGVRFVTFDFRNTPALKNLVTALCATDDGSLWIGTDGGGAARLKDGEFTRFEKTNGIVGNVIRCIYQTRDGAIWFGTTEGLNRYADGKMTAWTMKDGLSDNVIRSLCETKEGLWIGTSRKLNRMVDGKIVATYGENEGLNTTSLRNLWADENGELWFASNFGLFRFSHGQFQAFHKSDGLSDDTVSTVRRDRHGQLWVGSFGGLDRFEAGRFVTELGAMGEAYDLVNAILEDREGNLWIGAKDGLHRLKPTPFVTYTRRHGLTHNNIMSVCEDTRGAMWIATWGGGFNRFFEGKFSAVKTESTSAADLSKASHAVGLYPGKDGSVWMGLDYDQGLFRWRRNGETDDFSRLSQVSEEPFVSVRVIHQDRQGVLWLGTRDGLFRFVEGLFYRYTTREGLPHNTIRAIFESRDGVIWIGTQKGPVRWDGQSFRTMSEVAHLSSYPVVAFHEDAAGVLWIGTAGAGLCRIQNEEAARPHSSRITSFTVQEGLFSNDIHEIMEDDFGNFWISCRRGVFRVSKQNLNEFASGRTAGITNVVYGLPEGLVSTECNIVAKPSAWKSRDGRLWFATAKGLSVVDPKLNLKINETPPPVVIEEIVADKRVQNLKFNVQGSGLPNFEPETLNCEPGRGELEFHYTALSYVAPEKNRFRYRLDGVDPGWVEADTRRVAYYNNLQPGNYTFRVIACNNDGVWNSAGATVKLTLQPHYWQTWWFQSVLIALGLGFVGLTTRYATRKRMHLKLQRLEQQHAIEKERTRIAQDMHDDLGVRLTELLLIGEQATRPGASPEETQSLVRRSSQSIRDMVDRLDAIVWAVNPQNDYVGRTVPYIREYVQSTLESTAMRLVFDIPDDLPELPLSSEARHNLYMVVREVLNNIIKHADASVVRFRLKQDDATLSIFLEDDGKGFSSDAASNFGNGLPNMRKRMESIGGACAIWSEVGKGTHVQLQIPLR